MSSPRARVGALQPHSFVEAAPKKSYAVPKSKEAKSKVGKPATKPSAGKNTTKADAAPLTATELAAQQAKARQDAVDLCQNLYPGKLAKPSRKSKPPPRGRRKLPTEKECAEVIQLIQQANAHLVPTEAKMPTPIHTPKGAKSSAPKKPRFVDSSMEAVEQMVAEAEAEAEATGTRVRIPPIVFIHGIWSKPARWADFANLLNAQVTAGSLAACYNTHGWNYGELDANNVAALRATISNTLTMCKDYLPSSDPSVILVAHSKGGLLARAYLRQYPLPNVSRVSGLYFIGTPNCGSPMADFYLEHVDPTSSFDHCAFALGGANGKAQYASCARRTVATKPGLLSLLDPKPAENSICDVASFPSQPGGSACQALYKCQWARLCKNAITPGERVDLVATMDDNPLATFKSMVPQVATQNLQPGGVTSLHMVKLRRLASVTGTTAGFVGLALDFSEFNAPGVSDGCVQMSAVNQCRGDVAIPMLGSSKVAHSDEAIGHSGPGADLTQMLIADITKVFGFPA